MLQNLTYARKNQLLVIAFVMIVFLVYWLAIKKTINEDRQVSEAEKKIQMATSAPFMAGRLEKELMLMNKKIGNENIKGDNSLQTLLELVTNYCKNNHAVLREFPETNINKQEGLLIETNRFAVEGNFSTLINLVYLLEQKNKLGKVASVTYQLKKDIKTRENILICTLYLQNVKKKNDEK